jgi:hypothetical protein
VRRYLSDGTLAGEISLDSAPYSFQEWPRVVLSEPLSSASWFNSIFTNKVDCSVGTANGENGANAAETTGTSSQKYYGEFSYVRAPVVSEDLHIRVRVNHSAASDNGSGSYLIELRNGASWFLSLYHGVGAGADRSVLYVDSQYADTYTIGTSAVGTITPGTYQWVALDVWFSTMTGGYPNTDGRVRVQVDEVTVIDATNVKVCSEKTWTHGGANEVDTFVFGPMGVMNALRIYGAAPVTSDMYVNNYPSAVAPSPDGTTFWAACNRTSWDQLETCFTSLTQIRISDMTILTELVVPATDGGAGQTAYDPDNEIVFGSDYGCGLFFCGGPTDPCEEPEEGEDLATAIGPLLFMIWNPSDTVGGEQTFSEIGLDDDGV